MGAFLKARISAAWAKWRQLTGVLCDRRMPRALKSKVYKTVVRPVALYGSECWPVLQKWEVAMQAMEMRMVRWCLGWTRRDRVANMDVRNWFGIAPTNLKIREKRLRWYGHVFRAEEQSIARTAMDIDVPGRRPIGRPKKRWLEGIVMDMRKLNLTTSDALNRSRWSRLCAVADPAGAGETQRK